MARVVQQRGSPPYLLIVVVLLFLVATALAVLFYVRYDEKVKEASTAGAALADRAKDLDGERAQKLRLVKLITGREGKDVTADIADQEARQALGGRNAAAYANDGLVPAVKGLDDKIGDKDAGGLLKQIADLGAQRAGLQEDLRKRDETVKNLEDQYKALQTKSQAELAAEQKKVADLVAAKDTERKQIVDELTAKIAERLQEVSVRTQELDQAKADNQKLQTRLDEYLRIIEDLRGTRASPGDKMLREPDGKIQRVLPEQNVVYISLGEKDRVIRGLPFTVYSAQTGIPEEGVGKAQIVVNNVFATTSECRIVKSEKDDPIMEGDLIANVVFDPARTYKFVVDGEFDLYGEGQIDPLGARHVASMIDRFGGRTVEDISVDTDFVVLGEEPPTPPKPKPEDPPADWQLYKEKMEKYDRYQHVKRTALSLRIPILNTHRFLAFTGLVLKKATIE